MQRFVSGFVAGAVAAAVAAGVYIRLAARPQETLFGHRRYPIADPARLVAVDEAGAVLLQPKAARALRRMIAAASDAGVKLVPISGFRDAARQSWAAFNADTEWVRVRTESERNGKIVEKVESTFLVPTDFSPMQ